ncbi:hypothetical protein FACS18949_09850 [Clostridia bacterium]|nr:hypothetical protein FACS18949_09850 [Clostridia bacterium]
MNTKKAAALIAAFAIAFTLAPAGLAALDTSEDYGQAYGYNASPEQAVVVKSDGAEPIVIDLTRETAYWDVAAGAKSPAFISLDGGSKWKAYKYGVGADANNGKTIAKLLDRGGSIVMTTALDRKTKQPADEATTWTFGDIDKRPKAPKLKVYYNIQTGVPTGSGTWSPSIGGAAISASDAALLNVALAGADKKSPAGSDKAWGRFENGGEVPVLQAPGTKAGAKLAYLVRTAPVGGTPASKAVKLTVSTLLKAPALKPDFKKDVIKGKANISLGTPVAGSKAEMSAFNSASDTSLGVTAPGASESGVMDKDAAKAGLDIGKLYATKGADTDMYSVAARYAATGKKPASEVQVITLPRLPQLAAAQVAGYNLSKTAVTAKTGYELWDDEKDRWVASLKNVDSFEIRQKAGARYDAKKNITTGKVASNSVKFDLVTDDNDNYIATTLKSDEFGFSFNAPAAGTELKMENILQVSGSAELALTLAPMGTNLPDGKALTDITYTIETTALTYEGKSYGFFKESDTDQAKHPTFNNGALKLYYDKTILPGTYSVRITAKIGGKAMPTAYIPIFKITVTEDRTALVLPSAYEIDSPTLGGVKADFAIAVKTAIEAAFDSADQGKIDVAAAISGTGTSGANFTDGTIIADITISLTGNYDTKLSSKAVPKITGDTLGGPKPTVAGDGITFAGRNREFKLKLTWTQPRKTLIMATGNITNANPVDVSSATSMSEFTPSVLPSIANTIAAVDLNPGQGKPGKGATATVEVTYTAEAGYTFVDTDIKATDFNGLLLGAGSSQGTTASVTLKNNGGTLVATYKITIGN